MIFFLWHADTPGRIVSCLLFKINIHSDFKTSTILPHLPGKLKDLLRVSPAYCSEVRTQFTVRGLVVTEDRSAIYTIAGRVTLAWQLPLDETNASYIRQKTFLRLSVRRELLFSVRPPSKVWHQYTSRVLASKRKTHADKIVFFVVFLKREGYLL